MEKKPKSARRQPGKEKSAPVVFNLDDLEVEVAFDQAEEPKPASGSLRNAWFDLTKPRAPSSGGPIVNKPG